MKETLWSKIRELFAIRRNLRQKPAADREIDVICELQRQLATERDTNRVLRDIIEDQVKLLDIERERYESLEKSILDLSHPNCKDLLRQLDAEQKRSDTLQRQAEELHGRAQRAEQQLAAERKAAQKEIRDLTGQLSVESKTRKSLIAQLAAEQETRETAEKNFAGMLTVEKRLREQLARTERMLDLAGAQNMGIDNLAKLDDLQQQLAAAKREITTYRSFAEIEIGEIPGWEKDDGTHPQAQMVNTQWWRPKWGCDSLQELVELHESQNIVIESLTLELKQEREKPPSDEICEIASGAYEAGKADQKLDDDIRDSLDDPNSKTKGNGQKPSGSAQSSEHEGGPKDEGPGL